MGVSERILVIRHGAFGDMVQTSGALQDIRAHHPDAEIVLLTEPAYRKLMARCPYVDRTLPDARASFVHLGALWRLGRMLRHEGFARVYDLQNSNRCRYYRRLFLNRIPWHDSVTRDDPTANPLETYQALLAAAGVAPVHAARPDASWMADDVGAVLAQAGVQPGYVLLIPGCSARHPQKRWPYYAELASALLDRGYGVVTAPGPDELELARAIPGQTLLGDGDYLDWFGLAGVIGMAAFVVGNDTGPSHIASCMNRPGLVLFGSHTSARKTGILRKRFRAIEVEELGTLGVDEVLAAVLDGIAGADRAARQSYSL